ncbi:hypothetical protein [Streptomyces sp. bgisy153]|uniref:hypothetical protein n=1 Tax=Streptomyces sp. bgisy153 TaxID=3413793 RepID=UPI003D705447
MPYDDTHRPGRGRPAGPARAALALTALATAAALTTGCSGPGGVDLGDDWQGSTTFALARVDGLVTVVGINPAAGHAQSLAVVPQQEDDTDAISPHIVRLADGRWLLSVPRADGRPDRRYTLDRADQTLDGLPEGESLRRTLPGRTLVAEVGGLPEAGGTSSVLVKDPADWSTERDVRIPGTIAHAASDPASDTICLSNGTGVYTAALTDGRTTPVAVPKDLTVKDLACPAGRPVVVGAPAKDTAGEVGAALTRTPAATLVSVTGGRVDAVAATKDTIVIAAAHGGATDLVELDAATGRERHRATLDALPASLGITPTEAGWLVYAEDTVTRVDLATGATERFDLPGTLLDS